MNLCDQSAVELGKMLRRKEVSAEEILDSALRRIDEVDGRPGNLTPGAITEEDKKKVHSFITLTADRAREQANRGQ
jgi:aspartyl-tRNA(Asn)/glutamyl-tRNA(Gln) amidotransferase subunit A